MKNFKKLAGAAAVIMVIALVALFVRGNWGTIVDGGINMIMRAVTGQDTQFSVFQSGNTLDKGDTEVNLEW